MRFVVTAFLWLVTTVLLALTSTFSAAPARAAEPESAIPRTTDGKVDFQGIWQATGTAAADLQGLVAIPYQP